MDMHFTYALIHIHNTAHQPVNQSTSQPTYQRHHHQAISMAAPLVVMVAEKPSIGGAIANALRGPAEVTVRGTYTYGRRRICVCMWCLMWIGLGMFLCVWVFNHIHNIRPNHISTPSPSSSHHTPSTIQSETGRPPVHEFIGRFEGRPARLRVTSVTGHVFSTDFPGQVCFVA